MTKRVLLYFALLLWFVVPVTAQPTIFIQDAEVEANSNISVDIQVLGFTEILSMQFSVNWAPGFVQFDSVTVNDTGALPEYGPANFGTSSIAEGKLTTAWFDPALLGVSLADSTTIFTVHYTLLGAPGATSIIDITDEPTMIELSDVDGNIYHIENIIIDPGTISVADTDSNSNLNEQTNSIFTLYQNEPNPFDNQTVIRFEVYEPGDFELEVYDTKGVLVFYQKAFFHEGEQALIIAREKLPSTGTYFYKLKTKDNFFTNRMILVR